MAKPDLRVESPLSQAVAAFVTVVAAVLIGLFLRDNGAALPAKARDTGGKNAIQVAPALECGSPANSAKQIQPQNK